MTALLADPVVQCALHAGFALLFASAARHKWRDPRGFRRALDDYALLPARAVPVATAGL
ncbi:MAG: methylamine utilization protein MauE, partial [Deltaproteobacteria bacterium]|nr:methylamine utilization protein MauE [Deltaproteobacteria bacterium]